MPLLLQTFRTKISSEALSDDFFRANGKRNCVARKTASKSAITSPKAAMMPRVSFLSGKAISNRANVTASKSYNTRTDYRFDMKTFTELKNAQAIAVAYDGLNPMPPMFCYLKPYYNDVNRSYFEQLASGEL